MSIGKNIQHLRRQRRITQEQLSEIMRVSRQTVSKWEADEATPELSKLLELCDLFSCKLDEIVREDLTAQDSIYSPITIRRLPAFTMARYVIISPNPEDDVNHYMDQWAERSGLLDASPEAKRIGWDFPHVTSEQQNRFGLRGYVAAYILPEGYDGNAYPGVEYARQIEADYAVITVTNPFASPFERIPNAYRRIMAHLDASGFREKPHDEILSCFEYVYERDGITYMDVFIHTDGVVKADVFTHITSSN